MLSFLVFLTIMCAPLAFFPCSCLPMVGRIVNPTYHSWLLLPYSSPQSFFYPHQPVGSIITPIMSYNFPDDTPPTELKKRKGGHKGRVTIIILLILVVAAGGYWLANFLMTYRPAISSIPLVHPGGQVTINGSRFGPQAVSPSLVRSGGPSVPIKVFSWKPGQI